MRQIWIVSWGTESFFAYMHDRKKIIQSESATLVATTTFLFLRPCFLRVAGEVQRREGVKEYMRSCTYDSNRDKNRGASEG